jgi:hypothetical protein
MSELKGLKDLFNTDANQDVYENQIKLYAALGRLSRFFETAKKQGPIEGKISRKLRNNLFHSRLKELLPTHQDRTSLETVHQLCLELIVICQTFKIEAPLSLDNLPNHVECVLLPYFLSCPEPNSYKDFVEELEKMTEALQFIKKNESESLKGLKQEAQLYLAARIDALRSSFERKVQADQAKINPELRQNIHLCRKKMRLLTHPFKALLKEGQRYRHEEPNEITHLKRHQQLKDSDAKEKKEVEEVKESSSSRRSDFKSKPDQSNAGLQLLSTFEMYRSSSSSETIHFASIASAVIPETLCSMNCSSNPNSNSGGLYESKSR